MWGVLHACKELFSSMKQMDQQAEAARVAKDKPASYNANLSQQLAAFHKSVLL